MEIKHIAKPLMVKTQAKGFNLVPLGRIQCPLSKNTQVRGTDGPTISASDSFATPRRLQWEEADMEG